MTTRTIPRLPGPWRGLRIGLFGGSFNPAHDGHLHVARTALKHLQLDHVWWLVAAGNPLKDSHGVFAERMASARAVASDRRMRVTSLEAELGVRYTHDLLVKLQARTPGTRFVWLMGADNLASFHQWGRWRDIAARVPIAVIARPGAAPKAGLSRFARQFAHARIAQAQAARLANARPPAWTYISAPLHPASSTALRKSATAHG